MTAAAATPLTVRWLERPAEDADGRTAGRFVAERGARRDEYRAELQRFDGRESVWLVAKQLAGGTAEPPHRCTVGVPGGRPYVRCSCPGFSWGGRCKHCVAFTEAFRELVKLN